MGGHGEGGDEFAVGVVAVGGFAELDAAFVNLVVAHESFGELGALAEDDDEEAGGGGVEGCRNGRPS